MNYLSSTAIVLKRLNFSESDRIITAITQDAGKVKLMAKGVRKSTSKLAGGIELFSESDIRYIKGKNEIDTLISTRIKKNYGKISLNLETANCGYEVLAVIDSITEHSTDPVYYFLLKNSLELLDKEINPQIVLGVFYAKLLTESGHSLNLSQDITGEALNIKNNYNYNFEQGGFESTAYGHKPTTIKVVKLLFTQTPISLSRVTGMEDNLTDALNLLRSITEYYLHYRYKR